MSLVTIGDIHYTKLEHRIPEFNKLVSKTLRNTLDEATKRGVSHVVLVGDIFDNAYPSQSAVIEFMNVVTDYSDLEFIVIPGNHDFADITSHSLQIAAWSKKLKSNIRVISKPTLIKIDDMRLEFVPHPYVQPMSAKADYAFGHFAVNGAKGDNGYTVRTKNQPKGNWILGDFHTAQNGKVKGCRYDYVGSLSQLSWEEDTKKSVIYLEDGEKTRRKIDLSYKLIKYVVSTDDELDDLKFEKGSYYYVRTKNGYVLPKGWALEHPEVVRQGAMGVKKDRRAEILAPNEIVLHPLANLEPYLLSKKVEPKVVKRAIELAETIKVAV